MRRFDVIIIGSRLGGASTGIQLARKGYEVLVVDKASAPADVISTHFMNPRGMSYLKTLGVLPELLQATPAFHYFDVEVDGIRLGGEVKPELLESRMKEVHPNSRLELEIRYACIRRPLLDGVLQIELIKAGAELRRSTLLTGICGTEVELQGPSGSEKVQGKVIVGADGRESTVARMLNIGKYEEKFACSFACYSYFEGIPLKNGVMKKRNRLSVAAVPTSFGKTMVLVFGPKKFFPAFREDRESNFLKAIEYVDNDLANVVRGGKRVEVFRATDHQSAFMRKKPQTNVALVGDAASFKDQCTASGMTHALRDSYLIVEELDLAFQGKKDLEVALRDYFERHYLDLYRYYEFTGAQAEMNPLRSEETGLYRAISKSEEERNRFISLYFDVEAVKSFFKQSRIDDLTASEPVVSCDERSLSAQYGNPFSADRTELPFEQTCADYVNVQGRDLLYRSQPYFEFYERREKVGAFQYSRTLHRFPGPTTRLSDDSGREIEGINFASQDYLGLGQDPEIMEAAERALKDYGPHSAGSPMIIGNTLLSKQLEEGLKRLTGKKHIILFPTGYAAGMGSLLGIVKPEDHIVMDRLSHACLQQGARAATRKIHRYAHLDADASRALLKAIRARDSKNAILLISEGLFSMDADSPDLARLRDVAKEFGAALFVDVAHDLGATGPQGQGQMGEQGVFGEIELVMGSFSKTFAANGGFLATDSESLVHYLRMYSTPHLFSNALSPIQAAVALKATEIILSLKGDELRGRLLKRVLALRGELKNQGLHVYGAPSPIVPVFIGAEMDARLCHRKMMENSLAAMIIEYPVVPLGASRFRLQVMATHTDEQAVETAKVIGRVVGEVKDMRSSLTCSIRNDTPVGRDVGHETISEFVGQLGISGDAPHYAFSQS